MAYIVPSTEDIRNLAKEEFESEGEIEIDEDAKISLSEDGNDGPQGAYVQAWVYVAFKEKE